MSQPSGRARRSEKGLLTPDNCVVTLIDLQPQMLFGVANFDRQAIINNNIALAKATRVFEIPAVISTVETRSFSGNMWPQVQGIFPDHAPIERTTMNSWDDENFVAAIGATGPVAGAPPAPPGRPAARIRPTTATGRPEPSWPEETRHEHRRPDPPQRQDHHQRPAVGGGGPGDRRRAGRRGRGRLRDPPTE